MTAFQKINNREGYVKPIATYVGTVLNGSWVATASLPKAFSFDAGLPFNIAFVESKDRTYTSSLYGKTPTIFGSEAEKGLGGNEDLHNLSIFMLPYLQLGFGFYYTRIALRGMYFPSAGELQGYNLLSFGIQHSFGHFFIDKLPPQFKGFDVSLFFGYNSAYIGYTPDKWKGTLNLDFGTTYTALILGYSPIKPVEFLLSLGYQTVTMKSSGDLDAYGTYQGKIEPDANIDGRGGFRLGLEIAFSFGKSFHPVIGYNVGANNSLNANILYFEQTFGESESK